MKRLIKVVLATTLITLNVVGIVEASKHSDSSEDERLLFDADAYAMRYNH